MERKGNMMYTPNPTADIKNIHRMIFSTTVDREIKRSQTRQHAENTEHSFVI
jgi:hypothetical protein